MLETNSLPSNQIDDSLVLHQLETNQLTETIPDSFDVLTL